MFKKNIALSLMPVLALVDARAQSFELFLDGGYTNPHSEMMDQYLTYQGAFKAKLTSHPMHFGIAYLLDSHTTTRNGFS